MDLNKVEDDLNIKTARKLIGNEKIKIIILLKLYEIKK